MGGIESGADALDFLALGAARVAVGTASFRDPAAASAIRSELAGELLREGPRRPLAAKTRAVDLDLRSNRISANTR